MRAFASLLLVASTLAAVASATVQSNPYAHAAKHVKGSVGPVFARDAPRARSTSMYLTHKTKSETIPPDIATHVKT